MGKVYENFNVNQWKFDFFCCSFIVVLWLNFGIFFLMFNGDWKIGKGVILGWDYYY